MDNLVIVSGQQVLEGAAPSMFMVPSYMGPGDIVNGASAWWGLRAYNSVGIGSKAIRLRENSGNTEQDFNTIAGGGLDIAGITSFKGAASLFVTKLYDQTGHGIDLSQATTANQPSFLLNGLGNLPIMQPAGSQTLVSAAGAFTQAQPYTISLVANATTTSNENVFISGAISLRYHPVSADTLQFSAGTGATVSVTDSTFHAIQGVFNGASSDGNIDGSSNAISIGTTGFSNSTLTFLGGGGLNFTGQAVELGIWSGAFSSGQSANMNGNQSNFWRY